jgi:hypothetical protein
VEPKPGADAAVDAADDRLAAADDALNEWLVDARKEIGGSKTEVVFVSVNKVGAAQVESSLPMAWKAPGLNPCTWNLISWFQTLHCFQMGQLVGKVKNLVSKFAFKWVNLYRYNPDTYLVELPDRLAGKVPAVGACTRWITQLTRSLKTPGLNPWAYMKWSAGLNPWGYVNWRSGFKPFAFSNGSPRGRYAAGWDREGKRKGFERFNAPEVEELRSERLAAGEAREAALAGVLRGLVSKFCAEWPRW